MDGQRGPDRFERFREESCGFNPRLGELCVGNLLSRTWLGIGICLWIAAAAGRLAAAEAPPSPKWLSEITRVAYTDLPNRQTQGDWPDKFIPDVAAAGAQLLFSRVHSGEHWAGVAWKSEYGTDPTMQGDGTRHVVELCRKHGLRYLAYYWAQREPKSLGDAHPDWRCVDRRGRKTGYFCVNTPYFDLVCNRCVELVAKVGVDGVFFDMFHARSDECYCPACCERFRNLTRHEPPKEENFDDVLWQQWTEFKYRSIEEAMLRINRAIKAANPEAALIANTWNAWCYRNSGNARNSIRVAEYVDGLLEETGWYDTVDPSFFDFPALHNFMSWHLAGLCRGKRAFMWSSPSFARIKPVGYTEDAIRVACMMTNGSVPAPSVPQREVMARYLADITARDRYFRGSRLLPWCGLVVSEKTELWYGREEPKERYVKGVYGLYQTMLERHLPVSLVTDRDLECGTLEPYKVLVMPNTAAMSQKEIETVRRFVEAGGGLVATYETSLYDEHARPRDDLGLGEVLNARKTGQGDNHVVNISFNPKRPFSAHLYLGREPRWIDDPWIRQAARLHASTQPADTPTQSFPLYARMLVVSPRQGRIAPMRLRLAEYDAKAGVQRHREAPALVENRFGKGRVFYFPADLSWTYFRLGEQYLASLLEQAIREAAGEGPPVEAAAPSIVQVMTHVQDDRLVVHLLNDISSLGRSGNVVKESLRERTEVVPIHGIKLTFRDPGLKRFTLIPGSLRLEPTAGPHGQTVSLPPLEIHAMVVAEKQ